MAAHPKLLGVLRDAMGGSGPSTRGDGALEGGSEIVRLDHDYLSAPNPSVSHRRLRTHPGRCTAGR